MARRCTEDDRPRPLRLHGLALALASTALPAFLLAQRPDRASTEALARRAGERLQALQREAERLAAEEQTLLGNLRQLELDRQMKAEELRRADAEVRGITAQVASANDQLKALQQREQSQLPLLRARLIDLYKLGQGRYLRLLLSATDVRMLGQATRTVAALADLDRARIASRQETVEELTTTRDRLDGRRARLESARAEAARAQAAAERAAEARNEKIRGIDQRRDLNAQLAGELQAAQQKLQATLRDIAGGAATVEAVVLPLRPFRGDLDWPVEGAVRRRFRVPASRPGMANGIEIAAPEGVSAQAIHGGTVAYADTFAGFGNLVILDHGSRAFSLYGNLLELGVQRGARVEKGQSVGTVGPSPSGPPGLYFELRIDGQPVDPLQWLRDR